MSPADFQGCTASREESRELLGCFQARWQARRPMKKALLVWRAVARELRERRRAERLGQGLQRRFLARRALQGLVKNAGLDDEAYRWGCSALHMWGCQDGAGLHTGVIWAGQ